VLTSVECTSCDAGAQSSLRLTIAPNAERPWSIVVVPQGAVDEWRATAEPLVGKSVSLLARYARGFQFPFSSGFVLNDSGGVVMAVEGGPFIDTFKPGDVAVQDVSLDVTTGADVCANLQSCGSWMVTDLVFHGDDIVSIGPSADGEFTLNHRVFRARNTGGGYLIPDGCSDAEHASTWAIWQKAM
jgi:hypothetical protein